MIFTGVTLIILIGAVVAVYWGIFTGGLSNLKGAAHKYDEKQNDK